LLLQAGHFLLLSSAGLLGIGILNWNLHCWHSYAHSLPEKILLPEPSGAQGGASMMSVALQAGQCISRPGKLPDTVRSKMFQHFLHNNRRSIDQFYPLRCDTN
jgi:hypothetical protein